jgi:hypothetical protein
MVFLMIENASQAFMEIRGLLSLRQLLLEQRWFLHHLGTADGVLPEIGTLQNLNGRNSVATVTTKKMEK